jgi:hypothetical protein
VWRARELCAKSRLRVKSKQIVSREPVEGREHAACVLRARASRVCAKGQLKVKSQRFVSQEQI